MVTMLLLFREGLVAGAASDATSLLNLSSGSMSVSAKGAVSFQPGAAPQGKSISKTSAESADHLRRSLQSQTYRSSNWTLCLRSNSLYSS
jgi:DNA-binding transcriptional regulator YdaS (Cro superfamily)